jgi:hypothetical protein
MIAWTTFYKSVESYPWDRTAYLVAHDDGHADLATLLARYEQLRTEAQQHLPHGPGLFNRFDKVFAGLSSSPQST